MNRKYANYLLSKKWLDRKEKYYSTHSKKCYVCESTIGIVLHHKSYKRLGREEDSDLVPLCKEHHDSVHAWAKRGKRKNRAKKLWKGPTKFKKSYVPRLQPLFR